jgi:Leucine-rich repeat (LRR) protein
MLKGLPQLQELNLYGNRIAEIHIPDNAKLLSNLKTLHLGYNELVVLPDNLHLCCPSLRNLHVENNHLIHIPMHICCNMRSLQVLNVAANPLIEPDMETCERGIDSMRRYSRLRCKQHSVESTEYHLPTRWWAKLFTLPRKVLQKNRVGSELQSKKSPMRFLSRSMSLTSTVSSLTDETKVDGVLFPKE